MRQRLVITEGDSNIVRRSCLRFCECRFIVAVALAYQSKLRIMFHDPRNCCGDHIGHLLVREPAHESDQRRFQTDTKTKLLL